MKVGSVPLGDCAEDIEGGLSVVKCRIHDVSYDGALADWRQEDAKIAIVTK